MQNIVKEGRVNIETLFLVEKGALLFLSINLIAASLGVNKLAWSENNETEFIFGWSTWTQTDTSNNGITVIRNRAYIDCTIASCDASKQAGIIFFVLNMLAIILLAFCCIINLEMGVFHHTNTSKKIMNAFMAVSAFAFNLTAWCFWVATSDTTDISQANAGSSTRNASSFWYSVFACFFLFIYSILVLKQNVSNFKDKRKVREEARPLPAANVPTARGGRGHQDKDISKLLQTRVITTDTSRKDPPFPIIPDRPANLSSTSDEEPEANVIAPAPTSSLNNLPPPLPPRTSYVTPVVRFSTGKPGLQRKRSRGLPSVRTSKVVVKQEFDASTDEGGSVGENI